MASAGSHGRHATTDATTNVLRNGSSKHTSAATACATYSYGSHKPSGPHRAFLQGKRGCAWATRSWWISTARGKRYMTTIILAGHPAHYPLLVGQTTIRSTSPLPPNVPTGPRNQNKYKDRDGLTANVDGLDYGGGRDANSNTPPEERSR